MVREQPIYLGTALERRSLRLECVHNAFLFLLVQQVIVNCASGHCASRHGHAFLNSKCSVPQISASRAGAADAKGKPRE